MSKFLLAGIELPFLPSVGQELLPITVELFARRAVSPQRNPSPLAAVVVLFAAAAGEREAPGVHPEVDEGKQESGSWVSFVRSRLGECAVLESVT